MDTTLQLIFRNEEGSLYTISLASPKGNLSVSDVTAVMDQILGKNIFRSTGGPLTGKVRARLVSREVTDLVEFS